MVTREITLLELYFLRSVLEGEADEEEDIEQAIELVNALIDYEAPIH